MECTLSNTKALPIYGHAIHGKEEDDQRGSQAADRRPRRGGYRRRDARYTKKPPCRTAHRRP
jgi:hypothetical protein